MDAIEPFIVRNYLLSFLLPAWVVIAARDWWCHRRAGIERFGPYEPLVHFVLISLAGFPVLPGLLLEINEPHRRPLGHAAASRHSSSACLIARRRSLRGPEPHQRLALARAGAADYAADRVSDAADPPLRVGIVGKLAVRNELKGDLFAEGQF